jgi:hypothetical protein
MTAEPGSNSENNATGVSMDVLSLLRLLGRHWRVTGPAALLTLVGLVAALQVSSPTYNATGSIVLLNPAEAPDVSPQPESVSAPEVGQNPFTRYGDIVIVTNILTRMMNSDSKRGELASLGVADYDIVANASGRDPVFEVTGHGPDADAAIRSTELVLTDAEESLSEVQRAQGADPDYYITSAPLEPPSAATAVYGSTMRTAIAVFAFGGLGTLGLAVLAEFIARRRSDRRTPSRRGRVVSDATGEVVEVAGSNGSTATGSAGSEAGGEDVESVGSTGAFNSAGIFAGSVRPGRETGGSNGSPRWGRAVAPSDRRAYWRSSPPEASLGSPADEDHGQPTADR